MNYKLLIIMRSYSKKELANLAGVSYSTFNRWLRLHRPQLEQFGMSRHTHILPPKAVKYICDVYAIDLE